RPVAGLCAARTPAPVRTSACGSSPRTEPRSIPLPALRRDQPAQSQPPYRFLPGPRATSPHLPISTAPRPAPDRESAIRYVYVLVLSRPLSGRAGLACAEVAARQPTAS